MRWLAFVPLLICGHASLADTVFATQNIRAREVITPDSLIRKDVDTKGAVATLSDAIGAEAKRTIYAGHAIMSANLTRPAVIERNQITTALFVLNGLTISTEARALERGAVGDVIRAMNLTSKNTIRAKVMAGGTLRVLP